MQTEKGKVVSAPTFNHGEVKHINPPCTQNISRIDQPWGKKGSRGGGRPNLKPAHS